MKRSTPIFKLLFSASVGLCLAADKVRIKGPGTLNAQPGEFPYLAKIVVRETGRLIGAGVLLRSKVVLTNGFNYMFRKPSEIKVVLGEYDRTDDSTRQEIDVKKIKIQPELYRTGGVSGDVALLKLAEEPDFGSAVKVFGMENVVEAGEDNDILGDSDSCFVPGYGLTEWTESETKRPRKLKKFVPEMKKQRFCAKVAGEAYPRKKFLCAINSDLTATCKFDGGSPLLCENNGRMVLYGTTSGGTKYCDKGLSFFTRTATYRSWIKRNANKLQN